MIKFVFISVVSVKFVFFQGRVRVRDFEYVILVEENKRETFMQDEFFYDIIIFVDDVEDIMVEYYMVDFGIE